MNKNTIYYKYRGCSQRTWEILVNRELYFSLSKDLNDPLDTSTDIKKEYERAKEHIYRTDQYPDKRKSFLITMLDSINKKHPETGETLTLSEAITEFIKTRGILSLSKKPNDALLWSHYADGHRGVCLGFSAEILEIRMGGSYGDVNYTTTPPYFEKFLELTDEFGKFCKPWDNEKFSDEQGKEFYNKQVTDLLSIGFYTKSKKWEYEEEFRLTSVPGNHPFPPSALQEVILGAKISKKDETTIRNFLINPIYSHVKIKRAYNIPGTFDFGSELAD